MIGDEFTPVLAYMISANLRFPPMMLDAVAYTAVKLHMRSITGRERLDMYAESLGVMFNRYVGKIVQSS